MGRPRVRRTATIVAVSAAIHGLLLSALAIEVTRPGSHEGSEQAAIQVTLERPPVEPQAAAKPSPKRLETRPTPGVTPPPRTTPTPPSAQAFAPLAPSVDASEKAAMGNLVQALRGSVGCSNPDAVGLTQAERDACRHRLRAGLEDAKPLSGLKAEKQARLDHTARCQDTYRAYKAAAIPNGHAESNGLFPGLGYVPSAKDCAGP
jgi:hypothetical protein